MALAGYPGDVFVRWEPLGGEEGGPSELAYAQEKGGGWGGPQGCPHPRRPPRPGGPPSSVYTAAAAGAAAAGGFRINPQLASVFSDSEREALERAIAPGHDLLLIKEFVAAMEEAPHRAVGGPPLLAGQPQQGGHRGPQHATTPPAAAATAATAAAAASGRGLYSAALGRAARELVDPYISCLVAAEDAALQQPQTPLAAISFALGDHPHRLRTLRHVLSQVNAMALSAAATGAPLPSGVLLDFLWRGKKNGDPVARGVYAHLIDACAAVFSFQLCSWMLSGQLLDPYGEFFIVRRSLGGAPVAPACPFRTLGGPPQGSQQKGTGGPPSREEERALPAGAPLMETEDFTESLSVEALVFEWSRLFRVSVRGAPMCCFAGAPIVWGGGASLLGGPLAEGKVPGAAAAASAGAAAASTAAAAAAAAGVVLFVGRAVRVLARGGLWGEQQRQQLAPVALKIVRFLSLIPCAQI
ncbi:hypothetical protein ACSSS7_008320 [Eimeria intestinalis]